MENDLFELVNILKDNNYSKKVIEAKGTEIDFSVLEFYEGELKMGVDKDSLYIELNGFSDPSELDSFLNTLLEKFKRIAADIRLDKNKLLFSEINQRTYAIRLDLTQLKTNKLRVNCNNYIPLLDIKIDYCEKLIGFISNIKKEVSQIVGKAPGEYTDITQKQIVILFYHMIEQSFIGKGITKDRLAYLISELTAFSAENIRQDFSEIKKPDADFDRTQFTDTEYDSVKAKLKALIRAIEKDQHQKFPPKS